MFCVFHREKCKVLSILIFPCIRNLLHCIAVYNINCVERLKFGYSPVVLVFLIFL